jgi:integrase/recombinase XerD
MKERKWIEKSRYRLVETERTKMEGVVNRDVIPKPSGKRYIFVNYLYAKKYLAWVQRNRRTAITVEDYRYELIRFLDWFAKPIWELTIEAVEGYLDLHIKWATESARKVVSILTEFMRYLRRKEDVLPETKHTDPINLDLRLPKREKVDRKIVVPKEMEMLEKVNKRNTSERDMRFLRDKAILMTLYFTGVRVSEVVKIKWNDIREPVAGLRDQRFLFVVGKGGKERFSIVNEATIAAIERYCKAAMIRPDEPLFLISAHSVRKEIKKLSKGKVSGKKGYLTPHDFRRGFACYCYYKVVGMNILRVQEFMGHKSLETLNIYVNGCSKLVEAFVGKLKIEKV